MGRGQVHLQDGGFVPRDGRRHVRGTGDSAFTRGKAAFAPDRAVRVPVKMSSGGVAFITLISVLISKQVPALIAGLIQVKEIASL